MSEKMIDRCMSDFHESDADDRCQNIYNGLKCHDCSGPLVSCAEYPFILRPYDRSNLFAPLAEHVRCTDCEMVCDVKAYKKIEANARKNIETYERTGNINHLLRGMNMFESILQSSHSHLCSIYELVINQGLKNDVLMALNYIQSNLAIMEMHWGKQSYMLLVKENEYLYKVIDVFPYFKYQSEEVAKFSLTLYERTAHLARLHCVDHRLHFNSHALQKMIGVLKNKHVQKTMIKSDISTSFE